MATVRRRAPAGKERTMYGLTDTLRAILYQGFHSGLTAMTCMMVALVIGALLVVGIYIVISYFLDQFGGAR